MSGPKPKRLRRSRSRSRGAALSERSVVLNIRNKSGRMRLASRALESLLQIWQSAVESCFLHIIQRGQELVFLRFRAGDMSQIKLPTYSNHVMHRFESHHSIGAYCVNFLLSYDLVMSLRLKATLLASQVHNCLLSALSVSRVRYGV